MVSYQVSFEEQQAYEPARNYFIRNCGFDLATEKHRRMMAEGLAARERGLAGISLRGLVACYGGQVWQDGGILIDGIRLICPAFSQIEGAHVHGVYLYVVTAGTCNYSQEDDIMVQLYADIWGTSYVDAARDLLEKDLIVRLKQEYPQEFGKNLFLSGGMGPGFYGMPPEQTKDIFQILDIANKLPGVEVRESGIMLPLKTCAGLYLLTDDLAGLPSPDCRDCIGNALGCEFCGIRIKREGKE